jgi:hypothetical protein
MDRRDFLKVAVATLPLPLVQISKASKESFILAANGESWFAVGDPVSWSLENAREPILERATKGLLQCSPWDRTRILRLVTRRCRLNVAEVEASKVVVHYWGRCGQADLRPFFNRNALTCPEVEVVTIDRKRETSSTQPGDFFLYGERLPAEWPLNLFWRKWERRDLEELDDWTPAPNTFSGFTWQGIEPNRIPWAALKSAWRQAIPMQCPNCDQPSLLVNFGQVQCGLSGFVHRFRYACRICERDFGDDRYYDVEFWMKSNLDVEFWPNFVMIMGQPKKWEPTKQERGGENLCL